MAELEPEARDRIMDVFMARYNALHATDYDRFEDGPKGTDHDYLCVSSSGKAPLKVQHTRAWADPETEWRVPKDVERLIVHALQRRLDERKICDRHVSIRVDSFPPKRREKLALLEKIWMAVEFGLNRDWSNPSLQRLMRYERNDWTQFYQPISPYVAELEILERVPPVQAPALVGWSATGEEGDGVQDAVFRTVEALKKKEEHYRGTSADLVLVIDFEVMPYFQDELERIRAALAARSIDFREVWLVSQWLPVSADQVWPAPNVQSADAP
ncbi:MAG: hypothetical protein HOP12_09710 [Candidatus Eisenbacteria bacterium]|uniref:Uncharacterized protein n=1 Tax=Eiseniibacteriota bacterium TaxID=2212470 RepID=A0A849SGE1_UNCEI|nr:hypothetical protein [Candidatus Eisenbacteria bacterium]